MAPRSYAEQLESVLVATGVTGASFAYWDGQTLHAAVAGVRNSVTGDPVTIDTVMHIGSITKVINTVLLMQLVDEGTVALQEPVAKHLPNLRLRDMRALRRITCAMLVNHTSGINGDWLPDHGPDQERIEDAITRCAELEQLYQPGDGPGPSYCNIATVIAGYLTQKLRGASWYTVLSSRIFEPLGMHHALADLRDLPRFRCSVGDLKNQVTGKLVQTTRPFLSLSLAPAGSTVMMSATDLITFSRTLLNDGVGPNGTRILSAASAVRMTEATTAVFADVPGMRVGLGWMILPGGVLHHSGGGPGVVSMLYAHPASGRTMALLTNCDKYGEFQAAILDPILESWTGIKKQPPKRQNSSFDPRPYEGVYEDNMTRLEVLSREGHLVLRIKAAERIYDNSPVTEEGPVTPLYPLGKHAFDPAFEAGPAMLGLWNMQASFVVPTPDGRMQFMALGGRLRRRTN